MTITFPATFPSTPAPRSLVWGLFDPIAGTRDPFTGTQQLQAYPWGQWSVAIDLPPMQDAEANDWQGFLASLQGRLGSFLLEDPAHVRQGAGGGTPLVNGADQTGLTLVTDGWTPSTTVLKRGDRIQIGSAASSELKIMMADGVSDGSGNATLDIWPRVRTSPGNNTAVIITNPKGVFQLARNRRSYRVDPDPKIFGISFEAEEKL